MRAMIRLGTSQIKSQDMWESSSPHMLCGRKLTTTGDAGARTCIECTLPEREDVDHTLWRCPCWQEPRVRLMQQLHTKLTHAENRRWERLSSAARTRTALMAPGDLGRFSERGRDIIYKETTRFLGTIHHGIAATRKRRGRDRR